MDVSEELKRIYEEDQKDRSTIDRNKIEEFDWKKLKEKDEFRLKKVKELYNKKLIVNPQDMFYAGMIFQHGGSSENYQKAVELAEKGMKLRSKDCKWLYPRATDRYLLSIGKSQIWGTNWEKKSNGKWALVEPFDKEAKTEEERKGFGIDLVAKDKRLNR